MSGGRAGRRWGTGRHHCIQRFKSLALFKTRHGLLMCGGATARLVLDDDFFHKPRNGKMVCDCVFDDRRGASWVACSSLPEVSISQQKKQGHLVATTPPLPLHFLCVV
jgi:hypothetical protein